MILSGTGKGTAGEAGGGGGLPQARRPETLTARKLRRTMSLPEVLLWQRLRGRAGGVKFRRQHPIGPYVVDFYCGEVALIIEIDGAAHDADDRPARDEERTAFLEENGYRVIRVAAADVLRDPDAIAASIAALAASLRSSPLAGRGTAREASGGGGSILGDPLAESPLRHRYAMPPPRSGEVPNA